jgi:hypothetical protein
LRVLFIPQIFLLFSFLLLLLPVTSQILFLTLFLGPSARFRIQNLTASLGLFSLLCGALFVSFLTKVNVLSVGALGLDWSVSRRQLLRVAFQSRIELGFRCTLHNLVKNTPKKSVVCSKTGLRTQIRKRVPEIYHFSHRNPHKLGILYISKMKKKIRILLISSKFYRKNHKMENWFNFRDIENSEFVGVVMRKVVYLGHALTDFVSKTSFGKVIRFHWDLPHKYFSFSVNFLFKTDLEVETWRKIPQPCLMFSHANVTISTFLHPNEFYLERILVNRLFLLKIGQIGCHDKKVLPTINHETMFMFQPSFFV